MIRFYYRQGHSSDVTGALIKSGLSDYQASTAHRMARQSIAFLDLLGISWAPSKGIWALGTITSLFQNVSLQEKITFLFGCLRATVPMMQGWARLAASTTHAAGMQTPAFEI